jgi:hypothetical protein
MATPQFQPQLKNVTMFQNNAGSIRIDTKAPDGTPIDVHTGFTLGGVLIAASQGRNAAAIATDITGQFTAAFDATGVTLSWSAAQASSMFSQIYSQQNTGYVTLTNDSATTKSIVANLLLILDQHSVIAV